jgi:hypothetical protein
MSRKEARNSIAKLTENKAERTKAGNHWMRQADRARERGDIGWAEIFEKEAWLYYDYDADED